MNRVLKVIMFVMLILIAILVFPNQVNGVTIKDDTKIWTYRPPGESTGTSYTLESLRSGTKAQLSSSHIFQNKMVFCYEMGQELRGVNEYRVSNIFTLKDEKVTNKRQYVYKSGTLQATDVTKESTNDNVVRFAKGLAYILAFTNSDSVDQERYGNSASYYNYGPGGDDVQLALWAYLDMGFNDSDVKDFFGIHENQGFVYKWNDYTGSSKYPVAIVSKQREKIYYKTKFWSSGYTSSNVVSNDSSTAYDIYTAARNIYNGNDSYSCESTFYLFKNVKSSEQSQILLIVKKVDPKKNVDVKLNFYKEDANEAGLKGATIKVEAYDNVSSINENGDKAKTYTSAGDNGFFGKLVITPTNNNRNI